MSISTSIIAAVRDTVILYSRINTAIHSFLGLSKVTNSTETMQAGPTSTIDTLPKERGILLNCKSAHSAPQPKSDTFAPLPSPAELNPRQPGEKDNHPVLSMRNKITPKILYSLKQFAASPLAKDGSKERAEEKHLMALDEVMCWANQNNPKTAVLDFRNLHLDNLPLVPDSVRRIDLSNNELTSRSGGVFAHPPAHLKEINLCGNEHITEFPDSWQKLSGCTVHIDRAQLNRLSDKGLFTMANAELNPAGPLKFVIHD
ncbi:hypothetical protein ACVBEF_13845 [Glaciimonas sp. GG7]